MFRFIFIAGVTATAISAWAAVPDGIVEYIVTASPLEKTTDAVSQTVNRLAGDELHRRAAATLGETLEGQAGITSASFGPAVGSPVIRGQTGNRVRILQDSIGTLDAASSSPDHSLAVEPLLAERIEVLRGPASLRYGSGAIGGVVNVLDNRIPIQLPETLQGAIEFRHRDAGDNDSAVGLLEGGFGSLAWHVDGIYRDSNDLDIPSAGRRSLLPGDAANTGPASDHIANSDSRAHQLTAGVAAVADWGFAGVSVSVLDNDYGIPTGVHHNEDEDAHQAAEEGTRIDQAQTRIDLKTEVLAPMPGVEKLTFRLGHNDYEHTELEDGSPGTRFTNDAWESRLELLHEPQGAWRGAIGLQGQRRRFAAIGAEAFIPRSDIEGYGLFLIEEYGDDPWRLELGMRAETQRITAEHRGRIAHDLLSGAASLRWQLGQSQHLNLNISQSQRAPSVEELLSHGPHLATGSFDIGDSGLSEETAVGVEAGYHFHGTVQFSLNLFRNNFRDFIYQANTGISDSESDLPIFAYRQQGALFQGLEADLTLPVSDLFSLRLFTDRVRAELDDGADVPRLPPLRYGVQISLDRDELQAGLRLTKVSAQKRTGSNEAPTAGYTRLDGHISYGLVSGSDEWLLIFKAENLLDEEIRNATSFLRDLAPEAGRNFSVGLRYSF